MSTIRLVVNDELEEVLKYLEEEFKPLNRAEILKLGLAELMNKARRRQRQIEILDEEATRSLEKGVRELEEGRFKSFASVHDLISDLNSKFDKVMEFTVGKRKR